MKVGEEVAIIGRGEPLTTVTGVEMFRKSMDEGQAGATGPACCAVWKRGQRAWQVWPSRIDKPHKKFFGEVYVLKKEEGGRHSRSSRLPARSSTSDDGRDGLGDVAEGVKMVMPGDT